MTTTEFPGAKFRLQMATMVLGGSPQANRRTAQLGLLQRAADAIDELGAQVSVMQEAAVLDGTQRDLLAELRDQLLTLRDSREDYLLSRSSSPREFLFSDAFEDEDWHAIRHGSRRCFTSLREDDEAVPAAGFFR